MSEAKNKTTLLVQMLGVGFCLFHVLNLLSGTVSGQQITAIHISVALVLAFLVKQGSGSQSLIHRTIEFILIAGAIVTGYYLVVNYHLITYRIGMPNTWDILFGTIAIIVLLEATRQALGWTLPIVCLVSLAYALFGPYFPDLIAHKGYSWDAIVETLYLTTSGIHGVALITSATYVVMFIIFGAFLNQSGAGQFFIDAATLGFGGVRGGPAKIAVTSSALFGSISGVAVANVLGTGTFTIPLMIKKKYPPKFAAAVEAVASTGGQIMPPVMGQFFIDAATLGFGGVHYGRVFTTSICRNCICSTYTCVALLYVLIHCS